MMMRAQALLQKNAKPTDDEIRAELEPQSLPLRHPYAHPARRAPRRRLMDTAEAAPANQGSVQ